jgi:hypothetical protein
MGEHDDDLEVSPGANLGAEGEATHVAAAVASGLEQIALAIARGLDQVAQAIASADPRSQRHATHKR